MTFEQLKDKALSLPLVPGVYIMKDKSGQVIYVGKAKKLKNRVSQYFQNQEAHSPKTRLMVSKIFDFDVIVAPTEFEALVLECSLIKRHMPKYNILLKDDKGYPYVRLDTTLPYPAMSVASRVEDDGAEYFGPFGSRGLTQSLIDAIVLTLKLPGCKKVFPRDIGKDRPCLNYHMGQCDGWCRADMTAPQYAQRIEQARQLLMGNYKKVAQSIRAQMLAAAEDLEFELAAGLRDRLNAVEALAKKQIVTAGQGIDLDVIGYAQNETKACFAVMHYCAGTLKDKDYEILSLPDEPEAAVSSLLKQYYLSRGAAPKLLLLPMEIEDAPLIAMLLQQELKAKIAIAVPQRGSNARLVALANQNASEELQRATSLVERKRGALNLLGKMLSMEPPERIEAYDISHIDGTDIVGGMVVFENGSPRKNDYKRFKIKSLEDQNDYAAMVEVLTRRLTHYLNGDEGFSRKPDLLLIDGGQAHAAAALAVLRQMELDIPVFGMVKDDRHRTRALITADGFEIAIDANQAVFSFIGTIQEEVHRFAIGYHRQLRSKRLKYSELDQIPGIGPVRKQLLLKQFKSLSGISQASYSELARILPADAATAVYQHFHKEE